VVVRALHRRPVGVHAATAGVVVGQVVRRRGLGGRERRRVRGRRAGHAAGGVVVVAVRVLLCEAGSGGGGRCCCRDKRWRANGGVGLLLLGPLGEPRHPEVGHGVLEAAAVDVAVELPGVLLHPRPPVVLDLVVRAPRQLLRDLGPPVCVSCPCFAFYFQPVLTRIKTCLIGGVCRKAGLVITHY
jgi:hypothetical protein